MQLIREEYLSTPTDFRPIEFSHKSQYFALDVISDLGFGEDIGFLANDEDTCRFVETNDNVFPVVAAPLAMPWVSAATQREFWILAPAPGRGRWTTVSDDSKLRLCSQPDYPAQPTNILRQKSEDRRLIHITNRIPTTIVPGYWSRSKSYTT